MNHCLAYHLAPSSSKSVTCDGGIDIIYECFNCYDGNTGKYLWGSSCKAKKLFSSTIVIGKCGLDYTCVTTEIGECPYNELCPESSTGKLMS